MNDYSICLWKRSSRSDDPERFSDDSRGKKDERFMCLAALFADSRINGGAKISICTVDQILLHGVFFFQGHATSIFGKYLFGRRFEISNFRNICCEISCLPASPRIFKHLRTGIIADYFNAFLP